MRRKGRKGGDISWRLNDLRLLERLLERGPDTPVDTLEGSP